ncbi:hypothetical protein Calab_1479 [Caldithrix abyssi DSM 13497]|uniref:Integrase catalytic domain-containing protein n=1 Tax=Caldithrix abyssi DSM 13497 TaxID=880073 RepID=H1XPX4_CALAY|nr:hypothetical protein [Caldithrix abyssi]APF20371.1 hypothetical protein Cabys_3625 [Caldithrix abyssi DSM 13497]EHO41100.1 hypothetical protein Calab_1479 [Caldithrix abyssi DSM 13497]
MDVSEIKKEIDRAPWGMKTAIVEQYAAVLGISKQKLYRQIEKRYGPSRVRKKVQNKIDDELIFKVAQLKAKSMTYKGRELRTEDAICLLEERGEIPRGLLKVSTVNRRLRQAGFRQKKAVARFVEDFSNQVHYIDFSRSEYISIKGYDSLSGEYLLELNGKSLNLKNKEKTLALWLAGLRDGKSGLRLVRYYVATGENVYMGLNFLQWAWFREEDAHPLRYAPYYLRIDNGAVGSKKEVTQLLEALGIEKRLPEAYNHNAMGKIERTWRTFWQRFELYILMEKGEGAILTLSELNELAFQYCVKEAEEKHPLYRNEKKRVIYERDLLAYPPRTFDGDILQLASWPLRRKVGNDLTFSVDNVLYEAPERYLGKWVLLHRNLRGELVGQGEEDGQYFEIKEFRPRAWDNFRRFKDTYREKALKSYEEKIKDAREKKKEENRKLLKMKPTAKNIIPDSPHFEDERSKMKDERFLSVDAAKIYIARELNARSYAEVAHLFDELLAETLEKEKIDTIIKILKQKEAI